MRKTASRTFGILLFGFTAGALLPAVLCSQTVPPPMPEPIEELLERATDLKIQGQSEEALALARQAVELGRTTEGLAPGALARLMDEVGELQFRLGRHGEAEATYRQALEIRERAGNLSDPGIAWTLNGLATSLAGQGRFADAEPLLERALALLDAVADPDDLGVMTVLGSLGPVYIALGKFDQSDAIVRRMAKTSRAMMDGTAPQNQAREPATDEAPESTEAIVQDQMERMRSILNEPGTPFESRFFTEGVSGYIAEESDRFEDAARAYRNAVGMAVGERGETSVEAGCAWNALAGFEWERGRFLEAQELYRKAAGVLEPLRHDVPLDLAFSWTGLARLASLAGRPREARDWHERALEALIEAVTENHTFVASALYELASLPEEAGLSGPERESFLRRARSLYDDLLHPDFSRQDLKFLSNMMASVWRTQEATGCAARLNQQWAETQPGQTMFAANLLRQAAQQHTLWYGGFSQAVPLLRRAVELQREALGAEHPSILDDLGALASAESGARQISAGLGHAREATALLDRSLAARQDPREALREQAFRRSVFLTHLDLLFASGAGNRLEGSLAEEAFTVGQWARASGTALTLEATVARFGAGDAELADLARRFQDSAARLRKFDEDLLKAAGRLPEGRDLKREGSLRGERRALDEDLARMRSDLARRYPTYAELVFPRPVPLVRVQQLLGPREALLAYIVGPRSTYAWLVRRGRVEARRIQLGKEALGVQVSSLRRSLDLSQVRLQMQRGQAIPEFDFASAAALYRDLILPFRPSLAGVRNLFLVPDGPLESLPFGILVPEKPTAGDPGGALTAARWFVRDLATSVAPSVGALASLRRVRGDSRATRPFVGFGQPRSPETLAGQGAGEGAPGSRLDRMRSLRRLSDLQETRSELAGIGAALGGTTGDLRFGEAATETAVRSSPLADFRVIAFAAHALLAGEAGAVEPALVLARAGEEEDGRLTAGEIAELRLDADLVLLLGCNTAAADGAPESEGLSGLARAFFYAGSRALLVSHWAVPSEETVILTTGIFARLQESGTGLAESLRQAMLRMIDRPERPELAHPVFWAPFVIVGDGARRP